MWFSSVPMLQKAESSCFSPVLSETCCFITLLGLFPILLLCNNASTNPSVNDFFILVVWKGGVFEHVCVCLAASVLRLRLVICHMVIILSGSN